MNIAPSVPWIGLKSEGLEVELERRIFFTREFNLIKEAQTARGAQFESTNIFKRAKAYMPLFLPIFMTAFRRADELSLAMEARGYRTSKRRSAKRFPAPRPRDWMILLVSALLVVAQAFLLRAGI